MTTTTIETIVVAAGNGGASTPVKTAFQAGTNKFSVQMRSTTTRATTPGQQFNDRRTFTLLWATSPDDLTLATVPSFMNRCTSMLPMQLVKEIENIGQVAQTEVTVPRGSNLYTWIQYPSSPDAYSVVLKLTELP